MHEHRTRLLSDPPCTRPQSKFHHRELQVVFPVSETRMGCLHLTHNQDISVHVNILRLEPNARI